jgi:predicted kinase
VATVHLVCGVAASGKTTLARRLEEEGAFRFTLDEWMVRLFDLTPFDDDYGHGADRVKELIWDVAAVVLAHGHDVVLDWSQWSRSRRADAARRAEALGAEVVLHFLEVPLDEAEQRLAARNAQRPAGAHHIPLDELRRFWTDVFEPPSDDEPLVIVRERL